MTPRVVFLSPNACVHKCLQTHTPEHTYKYSQKYGVNWVEKIEPQLCMYSGTCPNIPSNPTSLHPLCGYIYVHQYVQLLCLQTTNPWCIFALAIQTSWFLPPSIQYLLSVHSCLSTHTLACHSWANYLHRKFIFLTLLTPWHLTYPHGLWVPPSCLGLALCGQPLSLVDIQTTASLQVFPGKLVVTYDKSQKNQEPCVPTCLSPGTNLLYHRCDVKDGTFTSGAVPNALPVLSHLIFKTTFGVMSVLKGR